ncbi:uncharacterized protein LOC129314147 [Prosopis cineraria]|uniref:uncharacterized protein LOC129314147 n=1 Tax=Prosopis cineraria TaxID=364024 RepID=UPI00240F26FB|nr:uncharacterized protein LOC129314147 [Prosopis cineraria]
MTMENRDTIDIGNHSHKHEVEKLLMKLNKPAVKSIKSPDGDTIDCVAILDQPAFDHPKLKNHKIQMRPNFGPQDNKILEESEISSKSKTIHQLWHHSGSCPESTIPIRRTREDDILRAGFIQRFGEKNLKNNFISPSVGAQGHYEYALVFLKGNKYYGAKGTMNVWNPRVQQSQEFSLSAIRILNDADSENLEIIEAGWQVNPELYGDTNTRLYTFWTSDSNENTGCYDLLCSGFVQVNAEVALGSSIKPLSIYNDINSQYQITITIWKDRGSGDWWMLLGSDKLIGYWPSTLFSSLSDSVTVIEWGGEVLNSEANGQHSTTQMGSGHFPGEEYGKASYFKDIKFVNGNNQMLTADNVVSYVDRSNCYNVLQPAFSDNAWGSHFYFGGPGRNPNCP